MSLMLQDFEFVFVRESDKAICVTELWGTKEYWLPKSQIEYSMRGDVLEVTMPMWLAKEKGIL